MDKQEIKLAYEALGQDWEWISLFIDFSNGFTFKKDAMIIAEATGEIEKIDTQLGVMWRPASLSDKSEPQNNQTNPQDNAPQSGESSTNSPVGSSHWYSTLIGRILHIGEFLKEKSPEPEIIRTWGERLYSAALELRDGKKYIDTDQSRISELEAVNCNLQERLTVYEFMGDKPKIVKLEAQNKSYREALEEIASPIKFMRARLKEGESLNGYVAAQLAKDSEYLRRIAEQTLKETER